MKKIISQSAKLLAALAVILCFSQCGDVKNKAVTKLLDIEAQKINAQCPIQISNVMRIDSCNVEDMAIKYYGTMAFVDANDFKSGEYERMNKPTMTYNIQTDKALEGLRNLGVSFKYIYYDDKGNLLGDVSITPDDYNKPIDEHIVGVENINKDDLTLVLNSLEKGFKAQLPVRLDQITILQDFKVLPNHVLEYTYVIEQDKKDLPTDFEERIEESIKEATYSDKEIIDLLNAGVTYKYIYLDSNNATICTLQITADDLK